MKKSSPTLMTVEIELVHAQGGHVRVRPAHRGGRAGSRGAGSAGDGRTMGWFRGFGRLLRHRRRACHIRSSGASSPRASGTGVQDAGPLQAELRPASSHTITFQNTRPREAEPPAGVGDRAWPDERTRPVSPRSPRQESSPAAGAARDSVAVCLRHRPSPATVHESRGAGHRRPAINAVFERRSGRSGRT